jgi:hypothetical protein
MDTKASWSEMRPHLVNLLVTAGLPRATSEQVLTMVENQKGGDVGSPQQLHSLLGALGGVSPLMGGASPLAGLDAQRRFLQGDIVSSMLPGSSGVLMTPAATTLAASTWICTIISAIVSIASVVITTKKTPDPPAPQITPSYYPILCSDGLTFVDQPNEPLCNAAKKKLEEELKKKEPSGASTAPTSSTSTATPTSGTPPHP